MPKQSTIGAALKSRHENILKARAAEEAIRKDNIARPFRQQAEKMVDEIMAFANNCSLPDELILKREWEVGYIDIQKEFKEVIEQEIYSGRLVPSNLITEFCKNIFENFKTQGGGKILTDFCTKQDLPLNISLNAGWTISCTITW